MVEISSPLERSHLECIYFNFEKSDYETKIFYITEKVKNNFFIKNYSFQFLLKI